MSTKTNPRLTESWIAWTCACFVYRFVFKFIQQMLRWSFFPLDLNRLLLLLFEGWVSSTPTKQNKGSLHFPVSHRQSYLLLLIQHAIIPPLSISMFLQLLSLLASHVLRDFHMQVIFSFQRRPNNVLPHRFVCATTHIYRFFRLHWKCSTLL